MESKADKIIRLKRYLSEIQRNVNALQMNFTDWDIERLSVSDLQFYIANSVRPFYLETKYQADRMEISDCIRKAVKFHADRK